MRISGTGFARLVDTTGGTERLCVLLNKGRLNHNGQRILSPIGGAFTVYPAGKEHLVRLGARDFEGGESDMRFRLPDGNVPEVWEWFRRRSGRETSVLREFREELTEETQAVRPSDLAGFKERLADTRSYRAETRRNVPERTTEYLMEIFEVRLGSTAMRALRAASRLPLSHRWVYFVTRREIMAGVTDDGIRIGEITKFIV